MSQGASRGVRQRILIVEDNEDLAFGLRHNLEFEGYEVAVAVDGRDGLAQAEAGEWDLIILDLMLPGEIQGFQVLERLRAGGDEVPVLILSARGEELDKVRGLRLGADDYLTKPFKVLELLARVEAILRRRRREVSGPESRPDVLTLGDLRVDVASRTARRDEVEMGLAPKEFDLLVALLRREGAVASRLDLLREVWGHQASVATRTVDTHIGELRKKLETDPANPELILTVWKVGYRIAATGAPRRAPGP